MNTPVPTFNISSPIESLHANERLKKESRHLRGNISSGLKDGLTGAVPGEDPLLMKFHGIYQQDDRDVRANRQHRKLEPAYQFMVRLRLPGGLLTPTQWIGLDKISKRYAERGLRITTRQTIQLHGVRKNRLKKCLKDLAKIKIDTISACGDDNRGVVCGANPFVSSIHDQVQRTANAASERFRPKTRGYREIWYDEPTIEQANEEPFYGDLYMPRKFKIGFVIPPINDIDVYGQDLGFIAVIENKRLIGYNVCVGGGMGQVDNREDSYPRLASLIGFVDEEDTLDLAEVIMSIQRDFGDRRDRHQARFKYTLDKYGMDWFINLLIKRWGKPIKPAKKFNFLHNGDEPGWVRGDDGYWHGTLLVQSGRIQFALQDQLAAFFQQFDGQIRLTANQNLQLINVPDYSLAQTKWRLDDLGLGDLLKSDSQSGFTLACVALPTCGLAMAEAERYLPHLLGLFNSIKAVHGIHDQPITFRITGCPNGCARPYLAEIALTGRAAGLYNLYLGGSIKGDRLAQLYKPNLDESEIIECLNDLLGKYAHERKIEENFGDFLYRAQILQNDNQRIRITNE